MEPVLEIIGGEWFLEGVVIISVAVFFLGYLAHVLLRQELEVISHDELTLHSDTLNLSGRPDQLVRSRLGTIIPYEFKSTAKRVEDSHRIQMGTYLLLVGEEFGKRPPYGIVELGNGEKVKLRNTRALRRWVLKTVDRVRQQRERLNEPMRFRQKAHKCQKCSQRFNCTIKTA